MELQQQQFCDSRGGQPALFFLNFVRGYADKELNCVKDYGRGAERLGADDIQKYTCPQNSEWKRRSEVATSFTANAVRDLRKTASDVPPNLQSVLPATDTRSLLRTLAVLREVLIDAPDEIQLKIKSERRSLRKKHVTIIWFWKQRTATKKTTKWNQRLWQRCWPAARTKEGKQGWAKGALEECRCKVAHLREELCGQREGARIVSYGTRA